MRAFKFRRTGPTFLTRFVRRRVAEKAADTFVAEERKFVAEEPKYSKKPAKETTRLVPKTAKVRVCKSRSDMLGRHV